MAIFIRTKTLLEEAGSLAKFTGQFLFMGKQSRYEVREFLIQSYTIGYRSLGLVGLTGFIMGLVLTMQLQPSLARYGVQSELPGMVAIAIIREIGPVLTALVFAGKIGSSIGAELGSMKVTEQIDAMEISGTNPFKFLVATRVIAATLMLPVLTILSDVICLFGSYLGVNMGYETSFKLFFNEVIQHLSFNDLFPALIKTFFFGFAVSMIGCYKGFNSNKGTRGVGNSANSAVVMASVTIFIMDLLAVQITNLLNLN
jgi:phospholipid/cholesterol/gamma-HCH transport system permease protein